MPPAQPAGILIELDSAVSGGPMYDRFDVMLRGRAAAEGTIREVSVRTADGTVSAMLFGEPGGDDRPPDGTVRQQRAFRFNLPRPGDGKRERCRFDIAVRLQDGQEAEQPFELDIDPAAEDPVRIARGPARPGAALAARPLAVAYIERAAIDADGALAVQGWAVGLGPVVAVEVLADGRHAGYGARTGNGGTSPRPSRPTRTPRCPASP